MNFYIGQLNIISCVTPPSRIYYNSAIVGFTIQIDRNLGISFKNAAETTLMEQPCDKGNTITVKSLPEVSSNRTTCEKFKTSDIGNYLV